MSAISATSSATPAAPSVQASAGKARLEQARREADQAEAFAQTLRAQADAAETEAQRSHDKVSQLSAQLPTDPTYKSRLQVAQPEVAPRTQEFLVGLYSATSASRAASGNALKLNANARAVINTQGQATGRILNLSV
jgi:hypothetical protein